MNGVILDSFRHSKEHFLSPLIALTLTIVVSFVLSLLYNLYFYNPLTTLKIFGSI